MLQVCFCSVVQKGRPYGRAAPAVVLVALTVSVCWSRRPSSDRIAPRRSVSPSLGPGPRRPPPAPTPTPPPADAAHGRRPRSDEEKKTRRAAGRGSSMAARDALGKRGKARGSSELVAPPRCVCVCALSRWLAGDDGSGLARQVPCCFNLPMRSRRHFLSLGLNEGRNVQPRVSR
jgi:hypothetical protein